MPLHVDISGPGPGFVRGPGSGSPQSSTRSRLTAIGNEFLAAIRKAFVVFGPVPPRTNVANSSHGLEISAECDSMTSAAFVVRNRQSATVVVSPALGLLNGPEGIRWAPEHSVRVAQRLLAAGEATVIEFHVVVTDDVPVGRYVGVVVWPGLVGSTPLTVDVRERSPS